MSSSGLKVQYDLRPSKQAERRMLLDAFQHLLAAGFAVRTYQYTGMGSFYFYDYLMFHKLLGIDKLWSVEDDSGIRSRVEFNRPFKFIKLHFGKIGEYIPRLSSGRRHILWLDYDYPLNNEITRDVVSAASHLSTGSILLITIDGEPPPAGKTEHGNDRKPCPAAWREYYIRECADYLGARRLSVRHFAKSKLLHLNALIVSRALSHGLVTRAGVEFAPLFNFVYADGHQMMTLGGMVAGAVELRDLARSGIKSAAYYRPDLSETPPFRIQVPRVTRKERFALDAATPFDKGWRPPFRLASDDMEYYNVLYRFLPSYGELLV